MLGVLRIPESDKLRNLFGTERQRFRIAASRISLFD